MFVLKNEMNHYLEFKKDGVVCFHNVKERDKATKFEKYCDAEWAFKKLKGMSGALFGGLNISVYTAAQKKKPLLRLVK